MLYLDQPALKTIEHQIQQLPDGISLAQGALRIGGIDASIRSHLQSVLATDATDYYGHSLGIAPLRAKLAATLSTRFKSTIAPSNIAVTHGSINGISALCFLLLEKGDEVLLPEPTYPVFMNAIKLARGTIAFVNFYRHEQQSDGTSQWVFDLEKLKEARTPRTKMLIIAHPSNPCGACMTQDEINALAQWCESEGIYCIFDEAYENYFFDMPTTSSTPLIASSKFLIRTGSFSKTYGMSGWRVGYVLAPTAIINHMAAVQDGLLVCPNVPGQHAALYALDHPEIIAAYTETIRLNRNYAYQAITPLIERGIVSCARPAAGFFLFMKINGADTRAVAQDLIEKAAVAVVPGNDFGPSGKEYVRVCYARNQGRLEEGMTRLVHYLQHLNTAKAGETT